MAKQQRRNAKSAKVAKRTKARTRKKTAPLTTPANASPARQAVDTSQGVVLRLPIRDVGLKTRDPEINFPRLAMQWTYVVRSRQRWSTAPDSAERQARAASEMLVDLGVDSTTQVQVQRTTALVEVAILAQGDEASGWAERMFPSGPSDRWRNPRPQAPSTAISDPAPGLPRASNVASRCRQSAVRRELSRTAERRVRVRTSERNLVRRNLKLGSPWRDDKNWKDLKSPTVQESTLRNGPNFARRLCTWPA